jgi:hypothetical protein
VPQLLVWVNVRTTAPLVCEHDAAFHGGVYTIRHLLHAAVRIEENTQVTSATNASNVFTIEDPVDFTISSSLLDPTTITIAQVSNGEPVYFLLKKTRKLLGTGRNMRHAQGWLKFCKLAQHFDCKFLSEA